ncbi:hypothetical protein BX600DRAFT_468821 [Xylariales sp. PMI_506]|nr:hypothetical protein BX600DRAFT_468821 [Xylariales sp. PMI_506]
MASLRPEPCQESDKPLVASDDADVVTKSPETRQGSSETPTGLEGPQAVAESSVGDFGNHSSSYWHPGWDFERYPNAPSR